MATMTIQSDADAALADYSTKLAAVVTAYNAMIDVRFPGISYADASTQASAVREAGALRDSLNAKLALAADQGAAVIALIKPLLPIS